MSDTSNSNTISTLTITNNADNIVNMTWELSDVQWNKLPQKESFNAFGWKWGISLHKKPDLPDYVGVFIHSTEDNSDGIKRISCTISDSHIYSRILTFTKVYYSGESYNWGTYEVVYIKGRTSAKINIKIIDTTNTENGKIMNDLTTKYKSVKELSNTYSKYLDNLDSINAIKDVLLDTINPEIISGYLIDFIKKKQELIELSKNMKSSYELYIKMKEYLKETIEKLKGMVKQYTSDTVLVLQKDTIDKIENNIIGYHMYFKECDFDIDISSEIENAIKNHMEHTDLPLDTIEQIIQIFSGLEVDCMKKVETYEKIRKRFSDTNYEDDIEKQYNETQLGILNEKITSINDRLEKIRNYCELVQNDIDKIGTTNIFENVCTNKNLPNDEKAVRRCPITLQPFVKPVIADDGHTYEEDAIKEWQTKCGTSPMTRAVISNKFIINRAMCD